MCECPLSQSDCTHWDRKALQMPVRSHLRRTNEMFRSVAGVFHVTFSCRNPEALILPEQLAAPVDLPARIVYFPVWHHSPCCAWHVGRLIREMRSESVLVEGPRDATPLLRLLVHEDTRMPVALYFPGKWCVTRTGRELRQAFSTVRLRDHGYMVPEPTISPPVRSTHPTAYSTVHIVKASWSLTKTRLPETIG